MWTNYVFIGAGQFNRWPSWLCYFLGTQIQLLCTWLERDRMSQWHILSYIWLLKLKLHWKTPLHYHKLAQLMLLKKQKQTNKQSLFQKDSWLKGILLSIAVLLSDLSCYKSIYIYIYIYIYIWQSILDIVIFSPGYKNKIHFTLTQVIEGVYTNVVIFFFSKTQS